jgi:queuine tRNA-ribosyltransferase
VNEILGARLNTLHNLHYYQELMRELRAAIEQGVFFRKAKELLEERKRL